MRINTAQGLEAVEQAMFQAINSDVSVLRDASSHILQAGGKRIRPRLLLLSWEATGGGDLARVIPVAAAVELVHTASVVHDDINDHGVMRRGRPSVNSIWGRTFALLTGDFLFTCVYSLMAPYEDLNIILSDATTALVEGETLQATAVRNGDFSRKSYMKIIGRKTAALFGASARLGAEMAEARGEQVEALARFGFNVGLAFQITDDILDLTADEDQLGKTAGLDLAQGKGVAAVEANATNNRSGLHASDQDPLAELRQRLLEGDTLEEARSQAKSLVDMAIRELDVLPSSTARDELADLALATIDRQS
ncbi:MAG: polyprenyl synthetase family protein [Anaerolineaceae bacterium]|nr:polyprenyl synthetase family protein [Anaerolineaceae bacterium]MDE0329541.1 polyprenyl synthetase family protein [Anaerolineaceae bacterium]